MKKRLIFLIAMLAILFCASEGFALNRKGIYLQAGMTLGGGAVHTTRGSLSYHSDRKLDGGLNAGIGYGITPMFVVTGEFMWLGQHRKVSQNISIFDNNLGVLGGLDVFVWKGLMVGAGVGLGVNIAGDYNEAGFGMKIGAGYEGAVRNKYAIGGRLYYFRSFYERFDYDSVGVAITFRMY